MVPAAATADRRLIINADDFGISAGVNAGILEAVRAGVVTSVSVMVNAAAFADGMRALAALPSPPGVGLHLNLTAGAPVAPPDTIPSLVQASGRFHALASLAVRACAGRIRSADVARETRAQLARLRAAWPDVGHLDSHQHAHALPIVCPAVAGAADTLRIRRPAEPAWQEGRGGSLKRLAIAWSWRLAAARHTGSADAVRGIGMHGSHRYLEELLAIVDGLRSGPTELIVHPGRPDATIASLDPYDVPRETELEALLSDALRERLERGRVRLEQFDPGGVLAA